MSIPPLQGLQNRLEILSGELANEETKAIQSVNSVLRSGDIVYATSLLGRQLDDSEKAKRVVLNRVRPVPESTLDLSEKVKLQDLNKPTDLQRVVKGTTDISTKLQSLASKVDDAKTDIVSSIIGSTSSADMSLKSIIANQNALISAVQQGPTEAETMLPPPPIPSPIKRTKSETQSAPIDNTFEPVNAPRGQTRGRPKATTPKKEPRTSQSVSAIQSRNPSDSELLRAYEMFTTSEQKARNDALERKIQTASSQREASLPPSVRQEIQFPKLTSSLAQEMGSTGKQRSGSRRSKRVAERASAAVAASPSASAGPSGTGYYHGTGIKKLKGPHFERLNVILGEMLLGNNNLKPVAVQEIANLMNQKKLTKKRIASLLGRIAKSFR